MKKKSAGQSGGALVIILVAVALFGALSYAVANMLKGGDNPNVISEQRASILADEILSHARNVKQAVQDLKISNGCEDGEISFENSIVVGYANPNASDACRVFSSLGGKLSWLKPEAEWQDAVEAATQSGVLGEYLYTAITCIPGVGDGDLETCWSDGEANSELVMILPWLTDPICRAINKRLSITDSAPNFGDFSQFNADHSEKFLGVYPTSHRSTGDSARDMRAFCAYDPSSASSPGGGYHFYSTLIAR